MLGKVQQRNKASGFTIIEVLIVLAIAGLIMLVVFLAVPALQRTTRNTQRRNDISTLLGAYAESIANNNGAVPASCNSSAATCWVRQANLGYYPNAAATDVVYTRQTAATAPAAVTNLDQVRVYNYAKCDTTTVGNSTTTAATNRSVIVLFAVETSGGVQSQCQES